MNRLICTLLALLALMLCACAAEPAATTLPPETNAPAASTAAPPMSTLPLMHTVRIDDPDTCIYAGPAFAAEVAALVGEAGVYTITEEATDPDGNIWGRLRSGLGWVCLTDPPLAPIYADYAPESFNAYHTYWCGEMDYLTSIGFTPAGTITDVRFGLLDWFETESWQMAQVLFTADSMDPGHPFLAQVVFWGDVTTYGISFTDEAGNPRHYAVSISGRDGSLCCTEYLP